MTVTGTVAVTVTVAVAGRAYGCRRATRVGGGDTKQNQFFRSHPPSSRKKGFGVLWVKRGGMFVLQQGRPLSDLLAVGFGETCEGRSQFELVMGGGVLSLGLAAGGPLQTLNKERGTDKKDSWTMGLLRRTVTCYLPRSDPQCHGSNIEEEADQGKGDEGEAVRYLARYHAAAL